MAYAPAIPGPPVGAKTITPGRMEPGDLVSDLEGRRTFTVDKVKMIKIHYGHLRVEVWWISGYATHVNRFATIAIPRQPFYLLRRAKR